MITDRTKVTVGTRLAAKYRGQTYKCLVTAGEDDKVGFKLDCPDHPDLNGKEFKSPSSAGSAVMGGVACNGWRFWSLEGQEPAAKEPKPKGKAKGKRAGGNSAKTACGECGEEFPSAVEASEHMATAHPKQEAPTE